MSEAPKKIWLAEDDSFAEFLYQFDGDISYIRADLVDGLVEALELLVSYGNVFSHKAGQESPYEVARAALKALKSAEIGRGME